MAYNLKGIRSSTIKFGQQVFPVNSNEFLKYEMDLTYRRAAAGICIYLKTGTLRVEACYYESHVIMDKEAF